MVHCALGVSRSPAIMICISRILGNYQMEEIINENNLIDFRLSSELSKMKKRRK